MKTPVKRCWSCTIDIPRRRRLTPDRRARCPRRSTNSTSFSPAWDHCRTYLVVITELPPEIRARAPAGKPHRVVTIDADMSPRKPVIVTDTLRVVYRLTFGKQ